MIDAVLLPNGTSSVMDAEARSAVFRDLQLRAYRIALLELRDSGLAWDAVQDASEALIRHYGDRPVTELVPLFYAILRNGMRDQRRRHRLERFLGLWRDDPASVDADLASTEDATIGPEEQAFGREVGARIWWALTQLSDRQREAFLLREWEQLSIEETALAMACSVGSVKAHHFRALRRLRLLLAAFTAEES